MELINKEAKTVNIEMLEALTLKHLKNCRFESHADFLNDVDQIGQDLFEINLPSFAEEWNANEVRDLQNIDLLQNIMGKKNDALDEYVINEEEIQRDIESRLSVVLHQLFEIDTMLDCAYLTGINNACCANSDKFLAAAYFIVKTENGMIQFFSEERNGGLMAYTPWGIELDDDNSDDMPEEICDLARDMALCASKETYNEMLAAYESEREEDIAGLSKKEIFLLACDDIDTRGEEPKRCISFANAVSRIADYKYGLSGAEYSNELSDALDEYFS